MQEVNCNKSKVMKNEISKNYLKVKRLFDITLSFLGLLICAPIILIVCIIVVLDSKGKPIYYQKRVGLDNKEFNMFKIRSMRSDAEKNGAQWAKENDPRITKIGKFIRKTRIDELPQLWNVFKGEMSIIGPRPEREVFYKEFEKTIPRFRERLLAKPGITGHAQVNGGYDLEPKEKLDLDLEYIEKRGIKLELNIIIKTFRVLVTGEGAR
ncbi:sugar transferase [uncultured Clostridium sp.]|uniref:sugar transferase n=1 Tax=uncultured Clostridium sp. TaxID=59620 RepID=UPI002625BEEC|nr:sugar transferase [uncultured Clostridium sp.]